MEICLQSSVVCAKRTSTKIFCHQHRINVVCFYLSQFVRKSATTTVGKKSLGTKCHRSSLNGRHCRGSLHDTILDWEDNLPEDDLTMADYHSK